MNALTVGELIALLQNVDPTLPVHIGMRQEYSDVLRAEGVFVCDTYVDLTDDTAA